MLGTGECGFDGGGAGNLELRAGVIVRGRFGADPAGCIRGTARQTEIFTMPISEKPIVAIVMGSDSDAPVLRAAAQRLADFGVPYEVRVLSAHRTPHDAAQWAEKLAERGVKAVIAAAGSAAHLAGVVAAHTPIPVIGVPIASSSLQGFDALLSTVQMPAGVPVATMAIGEAGAANAALFAVRMIATTDAEMAQKVAAFRQTMRDAVTAKDQALQATAWP